MLVLIENRGRTLCPTPFFDFVAPFMGSVTVDEVLCTLIRAGYRGTFTLEACNAVKNSEHWLQHRRSYPQSTTLRDPTPAIRQAAARFSYEIGRECLVAYSLWEEPET